jgi:hypothetical protein
MKVVLTGSFHTMEVLEYLSIGFISYSILVKVSSVIGSMVSPCTVTWQAYEKEITSEFYSFTMTL